MGTEGPFQNVSAAAKESKVGEQLVNLNLKEKLPFQTPVEPFKEEAASEKETPVEAYEDAKEVPSEFLVTDPTKIPNRCWGDDDASHRSVATDVPLIDLTPLMKADQQQPEDKEAIKRVIAEIGKACEEWGFFQVVNHGIPEDLMDSVVDVTNEFFHLPLEEKQKYAVRDGETEGYGRLDFNVAGAARTRFWNDVMRHNIRPTRTIQEDRMPNKPESYRPLMEEYTRGMEAIIQVVWTSLSEYLGLEPTTLQKAQEEDYQLIIRLNYYPKCPEPEKVLGVGAHKDFGSITVLHQDEVGGLQVHKRGSADHTWLDVLPKKGALLINIANQVEIMSNGKYHSVLHRVLVNRNSSRVSIAAFATPGPKCIIAPLKELLEKTQERPLYKELLYGNYATDFAADAKKGINPHIRYEINRD